MGRLAASCWSARGRLPRAQLDSWCSLFVASYSTSLARGRWAVERRRTWPRGEPMRGNSEQVKASPSKLGQVRHLPRLARTCAHTVARGPRAGSCRSRSAPTWGALREDYSAATGRLAARSLSGLLLTPGNRPLGRHPPALVEQVGASTGKSGICLDLPVLAWHACAPLPRVVHAVASADASGLAASLPLLSTKWLARYARE